MSRRQQHHRLAIILFAAACATKPASPPTASPTPDEPVQDQPPQTVATHEALPEAPTIDIDIDIGSTAAGEGIVFVRTDQTCEAWQFIDGGHQLEFIADASIGLTLSYTVDVRGPTRVAITGAKASSASSATNVACEPEAATREVLFAEEEHCQANTRGIEIARGCPSVLLGEQRRTQLLHRIESQRAAALAERRDQAPKLVASLRRSLNKRKVVYWQDTTDGATQCTAWKYRRGKLQHTSADGSWVRYEITLGLNARSGLAEVDMTGPDYGGPDGSSGGIGSWNQEPLTQIDERSAVVGGRRWFFSKAACVEAQDASS